VLATAPDADEVWCLGDVVGYGPDPNECVELLRGRKLTCVAGNHDLGAIGELDLTVFNADAREACEWTARALSEESRAFLQSLPRTAVAEHAFLAHGSPREPPLEYLLNVESARPNFEYFSAPICLVGHTHVPLVFTRSDEEHGRYRYQTVVPPIMQALDLQGLKAIVNPGSVGQSRDGNSDAAYMIFDPESLTVSQGRVAYDISITQTRILDAGLPSRLAARLSYGW